MARLIRRRATCALVLAVATGCGGDGAEIAVGTEATGPTTTPVDGGSTVPGTPAATLATLGTDPGSAGGGWSLPAGPEGPGGDRNRDIYRSLYEDDCAGAQTQLDRSWGIDDEEQHPIRSPRDVLLFQAAIAMCADDRVAAATWLARARALGLTGLATPVATSDEGVTFPWYCEVFRSLVTALDGVGRDSVDCPGGDPPAWPPGPRDDPRTDADESTTTTSVGDATTVPASTSAPSTTVTTGPPPTSASATIAVTAG